MESFIDNESGKKFIEMTLGECLELSAHQYAPEKESFDYNEVRDLATSKVEMENAAASLDESLNASEPSPDHSPDNNF